MKVIDIMNRAQAVCDKLPVRTVSAATRQSYRRAFARMWREPVLDPLLPGIARDTYNFRRAALHWAGRLVLERAISQCYAAGQRDDLPSVQRWAAILLRLIDRIEPSLERDPPLSGGTSTFHSPASRWREQEGPLPRRGERSKKAVLGRLPRDWDKRLWHAGIEFWNSVADRRDLEVLAVALTAPVRPEEFVPGERTPGWSDGVLVNLTSAHCLEIAIAPAKNHGGKFGTGVTVVKIDPIEEPARYLADCCFASGGQLMINLPSKNAHRKKLKRLGEAALPEYGVTITGYVCRHQIIADLKATFGAGLVVAGAAGQTSDRTQANYGRAEHGRKRRGWISIEYLRVPRVGNVTRARDLGRARRLERPDDGRRKVPEHS